MQGLKLMNSQTVIGAIILALGRLLQMPELSQYSDFLTALAYILQGVGILWTVIGGRRAIGKAAQGVVQLHPLSVVIAASWVIGLLFVPRTLPTPPLTLEVDEWYPNFVGDSLRYVIRWTQPPDTATLGKVDSTVYKFTSTKGVTFYGSTGLTTPNTNVRRVKTGLADSLKLAKPAVGDSVTFQITGFIECRKGDCSVPGSAAWKYRRSLAPPPAAPTIQITEF